MLEPKQAKSLVGGMERLEKRVLSRLNRHGIGALEAATDGLFFLYRKCLLALRD